jgi:hypothetical protein
MPLIFQFFIYIETIVSSVNGNDFFFFKYYKKDKGIIRKKEKKMREKKYNNTFKINIICCLKGVKTMKSW